MTRDEKLAVYRELVAGFDDLAIKGKATPYTAINGNMFSFLGQEDVLAFRLSATDQRLFEDTHGPSEVKQYGSVMRGYVGLPDSVISDSQDLKSLFGASYAFAKSLKPKATRK